MLYPITFNEKAVLKSIIDFYRVSNFINRLLQKDINHYPEMKFSHTNRICDYKYYSTFSHSKTDIYFTYGSSMGKGGIHCPDTHQCINTSLFGCLNFFIMASS